jgi:phenylalanyl-tRNA synthetase beta chain
MRLTNHRCGKARVDCAKYLIAICGDIGNSWLRKGTATYFDLKGAVENVLEFLGLESYHWRGNDPLYSDRNGATLNLGPEHRSGTGSGCIWEVPNRYLRAWDIANPVFFGEMDLDVLLPFAFSQQKVVKPIPKFPFVRRDIAFVVDKKAPVKAIEVLMKKAASPYLQSIELFDQYVGKNIPGGKRSLAFSLSYQKDTGTFTDEEINALQGRVGDALKTEYKVEFR